MICEVVDISLPRVLLLSCRDDRYRRKHLKSGDTDRGAPHPSRLQGFGADPTNGARAGRPFRNSLGPLGGLGQFRVSLPCAAGWGPQRLSPGAAHGAGHPQHSVITQFWMLPLPELTLTPWAEVRVFSVCVFYRI